MTSSLSSSRFLLALAALAGASAMLAPAVQSAPLDAEACSKVKTEHQQLENDGIEQDMAKGPDWARANMGLKRLSEVRRFIELEELILFRCRSKSLVALPPDPSEKPSPAAGEADKGKDQKESKAATRSKRQETVVSKTAPKAAAGSKQKPPAARKPAAKAAAARPPAQIEDGAGTSSIAKTPPKSSAD